MSAVHVLEVCFIAQKPFCTIPASGGMSSLPPTMRAPSATATSMLYLGTTPKAASPGEPRRLQGIGSRKRPLQEETQLPRDIEEDEDS